MVGKYLGSKRVKSRLTNERETRHYFEDDGRCLLCGGPLHYEEDIYGTGLWYCDRCGAMGIMDLGSDFEPNGLIYYYPEDVSRWKRQGGK